MRNDKKVFKHLGGWSYIKGIIDGEGALTDDQKVIWIWHLLADTPNDPMFNPLTIGSDEKPLEMRHFVVYAMNQYLKYMEESIPTSKDIDKLKNDYQALSHCLQWVNGYLRNTQSAQPDMPSVE